MTRPYPLRGGVVKREKVEQGAEHGEGNNEGDMTRHGEEGDEIKTPKEIRVIMLCREKGSQEIQMITSKEGELPGENLNKSETEWEAIHRAWNKQQRRIDRITSEDENVKERKLLRIKQDTIRSIRRLIKCKGNNVIGKRSNWTVKIKSSKHSECETIMQEGIGYLYKLIPDQNSLRRILNDTEWITSSIEALEASPNT